MNVNDVTSPEQKIRDAFFDQHLQLSEHDDGPESTKSIVSWNKNKFILQQEQVYWARNVYIHPENTIKHREVLPHDITIKKKFIFLCIFLAHE